MAREDALIAVFYAKYHYEFWRPVTAACNGDIDNNSATERDAASEPIDATPILGIPVCSLHLRASLVGVMGSCSARRRCRRCRSQATAPGVVHRSTNVGLSPTRYSEARIWAGFHYRLSTKVGQDMGHKIGEYVAKNLMQPAAIVAR
jgi:hypothetical protein